ncbi:ATP-binding protein [Sphingomonas sp.]|uniref:ATP-binding protein n=1 Tax=Sphingomonas sp. TaxID=28214 RepID=UPI0017CB684C|nr:ATP-binding protein [Sphingomonas sp.]MBA4760505.1 HAMP domain-containing protein [Sphingomonas sp.]
MKPPHSLGRQLAMSMVMVTVSMVLLTLVAFYATYWLFFQFAPSLLGPEDSLLPNGADLVVFVLMSIIGLLIASRVAYRTAVRIVAPVTSVAHAARRVAQGDLSARVAAEPGASGEMTALVDDFNAMAGRLERMASDAVAWNAQIAHELRTPLTILRGRLQGVADGVFTMDDRLVTSLARQVEDLTRLVEDLRVVSLFDSGHLALDLVEVSLADEVRDLAELLRPALDAAGFTLVLRLDDGLSVLDPGRIRQALTAIIDNALKYADPGPIHIDLELKGTATELRIADSGPGLPGGFVSSAFDRFSRAGEQSNSVRGSGLGLAVVRAILEAHGGSASYSRSRRAFVLSLPPK